MLPPRFWPTHLWVAAAALGLLLVHAIALGIQLILVQAGGGIPEDITAPGADTPPPIVESYAAQITAGFAPGLVILLVGMYTAIRSARLPEPDVAAWGRIFVVALALVAGGLLALAAPWTLAQ